MRLLCILLVWAGLSLSLVPNSNRNGPSDSWSRGNNRNHHAPFLHVPIQDDECYDNDGDDAKCLFPPPLLGVGVRGGARRQKREPPNPTESMLKRIKSYWQEKWNAATTAVGKPFQKLAPTFQKLSPFKSKAKTEAEENEALQKELMERPIQVVVVPNSTVLPTDVVEIAARRSGMVGRPLQSNTVQEFARAIKRYYTRKGMMLHSVTGVTLQAETNTAEIAVEEPKVHEQPLQFIFLKQMVVDEESGNLMTFKQYRDYRKRRNTRGVNTLTKSDLNTTYVTSPDGRTSPEKVAKAMQLQQGSHFQWDNNRWNRISSSGIFRNVLGLNPKRMQDGNAQVQVLVEESPPRSLEYGAGKSLYTNGWEGEINFEHSNLLGGGETVGVTVKRGTHDVEPSVRVRYADDKFGLERGYAFEAFSDFIGDQVEKGARATDEKQEEPKDYDNDDLLDRKGVLVRLRNPIDPSIVKHSTLSATVERTSTTNGQHERLGSTTLAMGPFRQELPLDARSNVAGSVTLGSKFVDEQSSMLQPYVTVTGSTRQVIPVGSADRPITIAFQHRATTSSRNLPRHERNALWNAARIRGYTAKDKGRLSSSVVGTTEVRIPVTIPAVVPPLANVQQDASVVLYADWSVAQNDWDSPFFRKSSVGVGLRKSIQGLALKYDVSYTMDGNIRGSFGLGTDFNA